MRILVTGGCGFIGSNLILKLFDAYPEASIINVDSLTYAARPEFVRSQIGGSRYAEANIDIRDRIDIEYAIMAHTPHVVFHLAAESHVCNSIKGPGLFYETNVMGTFNVCEAIRKLNECRTYSRNTRLIHISTDEVFGSLPMEDSKNENIEDRFRETTPLDPRSPYSSSKASSDMIVKAYIHTYGLSAIITNCSNNYGPNQHTEKLVPMTINNILNGKPVIVHGDGSHIRDWLYVEDHCEALIKLSQSLNVGARFCIGGETELTNLTMVSLIDKLLREKIPNIPPMNIQYKDDRPTDDERYSVDISKIRGLGWEPKTQIIEGLSKTIDWYIANKE